MPPQNTEELEDLLSLPTPAVIEAMARLQGDIMLLGVAGKMGPSLARMAKRASEAAGVSRRVIGVSRFQNPGAGETLRAQGIETIPCDLLDRQALANLPDVPNIIYLAGMKFGATGNEPLTWAMNTHLPALVCERFRHSRIAAFSTGNVYGLISSVGGSREDDVPNPAGEYAMSCLGRERMFQYFSESLRIPMALIRLNYACDLRYGVLVDIAQNVWSGEPVEVAMGYFNTIWQGDANALTLLAFDQVSTPPWIVNLTGPELLKVRDVAREFGRLFRKSARFTGREAKDALISDATRCFDLLGKPLVSAEQLIAMVAAWIKQGGALLGKPTHFQARDGKF